MTAKRMWWLGALALAFDTTAAQMPEHSQQPDDSRPHFSPSYDVHIAPTTLEPNRTGAAGAPDYWSKYGYTLKKLIAEIWQVDERRVDFTDEDAARKRYDVALVMPRDESDAVQRTILQEGIQQHFNLIIAPEIKPREVYVVTAPHGDAIGLKRDASGGGSIGSTNAAVAVKMDNSKRPTAEKIEQAQKAYVAAGGIAVDRISMSGGTIAMFCKELEHALDRPVLDETGLRGSYDLEVERGGRDRKEFFALLATMFGLMVEPAQRDLPMVSVRTR